MDNRRIFLFGALLFVAFLIYQAWMQDYGPRPVPAAATVTTEAPPSPATSAAPVASAATPAKPTAPSPLAKGQDVHVRTDVLDVVINTAGADIRRAELLEYPQTLKTPDQLVAVVDDSPENLLVLQSGLQSADSVATPGQGTLYHASGTDFALKDGDDALDVAFTWSDPAGLQVTKTYHFMRASYQIGITYAVHNVGTAPWSGSAFAQWQNHYVPVGHSLFSSARYDYQRVALYGSDGYQQHEFPALADKPVSQTVPDGWAAVVEHYFLAAVIPETGGKNLYYTRALGDSRFLVGTVSSVKTAEPGASATFADKLFIGPKLQTRLAGVAPGLELTVDYGKLTIIAQPIFWVLEHIEKLIGNWGWSILLLTVLIKLVTYKLNEISGRSMAKMRQVQPRIKAIQERYADDRQRMSQAMMELYKKEKINPASGCFPILIQIPIFFALYYVLVYSVELRHAPWTLWIHDLSAPDPFYVLPVFYGIAMFVQQHLQPQPTDKMQARLMKIMPLALVALYAVLPAGLVLYYLANSLISIVQQRYINRLIERESKKD